MGRLHQYAGLTAILTLLVLTSVQPAMAVSSPFLIRKTVTNHDLTPFTKWTSLMPRYYEQKDDSDAACKDGEECEGKDWETMLSGLQGKSNMAKMVAVNAFFNKVPYIEDKQNFGADDYWQTPYEMMKRGGDCEDYAIAKYISLKRLGVAESNMRILIVQDSNLGGIMHAVLEVKMGGVAYILDNQAQQVIAANRIYHYNPIYAINEAAWWAYV